MKTSVIFAAAVAAVFAVAAASVSASSPGCCGAAMMTEASFGVTSVVANAPKGQWPSTVSQIYYQYEEGNSVMKVNNFTFQIELYTRGADKITQLYLPQYNICQNQTFQPVEYHQLCVGPNTEYPTHVSEEVFGHMLGQSNALVGETWATTASAQVPAYLTVNTDRCMPIGFMSFAGSMRQLAIYWNITSTVDASVFDLPAACDPSFVPDHLAGRSLREATEAMTEAAAIAKALPKYTPF